MYLYEDDDVQQYCTKHTTNYKNTHYGYCIYCILEGELWEEEWDSWSEVVSRAKNIIEYGYEDARNNESKLYDENDKYVHESIITFRELYNYGVKLFTG